MLRTLTPINYTILLLLVVSCRTLAPPIPEFYSESVTDIAPIVSRLNVDIELNIESLLAQAEESTPLIFKGSSGQCEGVSYTYEFSREPIVFSTSSSHLQTQIDGGFSLDITYCPLCISLFGNESCTVPRIYASCGINEKPIGYSMKYATKLGLSKNYDLSSKTVLKDFTIKDPCELTFLNYDVTEHVQLEIAKELKSMQTELDEKIEKLEVRKKIEDAWIGLQLPISIEPYGFLQINPKSFSTTELSYDGKIASFSLSLFFSPLISTEARPKDYVPLSEMSIEQRAEGFEITTDLEASYDSLSVLLTKKLAGDVVLIKNKKIVVRSLRIMGSQSDKLILKMEFDGFRKGAVYFVCRPSLDIETQELRLTDIEFEFKTKAILLKSAEWLIGNKIRNKIMEKSRLDMSENLNTLRATVENKLNGGLFPGIMVSSKIEKLTIRNILLGPTHLFVRTSLSGAVKISID